MLTSSTINHDLYRIRKALTMLVASVVLCLVSDVTEDAPLPGVCLERHEDSPVVSSPIPNPSSCSDNDGTVITFRMLCRFEFSVYRCYVDVCVCVCVWMEERKQTFCMQHEIIVCPSQKWVHFIRFWHHVQTDSSLVFILFTTHSVLVTFSRAQVFLFVLWLWCHSLLVRFNVLLGMDFFFSG